MAFEDVSEDIVNAYNLKLAQLMTDYASKEGCNAAAVLYCTMVMLVGNLARRGIPKKELMAKISSLYDEFDDGDAQVTEPPQDSKTDTPEEVPPDEVIH